MTGVQIRIHNLTVNKKYSKRIVRLTRGICGLLTVCFSFGFGYVFSSSSWSEEISIARNKTLNLRGLASKEGNFEITTVSNSFLNPQTLFDQAYQVSESDHVLFSVGNIISKDLKGNKNFVCDAYSQVQFYFEADGIFQRGRPLSMKLYSSCEMDQENGFIGPFLIPTREILNSPLSKKKFSSSDGNVEIFFDNVNLARPRTWILREVIFQSNSLDQYRVEAQIPETEEESFFTIEF